MKTPATRTVIVVGRDAALWLTAATLQKALSPTGVAVKAVELPTALGPADVYATQPALEALHNQLRIDEAALLRLTRGAFSLGQNFTDSVDETAPFLHPYGAFGTVIAGQDFFAYWLKARQFGLPVSLEDFSLTAAAARHGKLLVPDEETEIYGRSDYGYHLPAIAYARKLKAIAIQIGVEARSSSMVSAMVTKDGSISALQLDDGEQLAGELFVDASGTEGVLVRSATGIERESWREHFPADRILAASAPALPSIPAYAEIRAGNEGWTGLYPSQAQTHVIHAFSSEDFDDDSALEAASVASGMTLANAIVRLSDPGRNSNAWVKNCVAIGSAAVEFDPLHSVELHAVQLGLVHLLACFPAGEGYAAQRAEYNRLTGSSFDRIRDFQAAHYALNRYGSSRYWTRAREATPPAAVAHMIATFKARGEIAPFEEESFAPDSWRALFIGHGLVPDSYRPTIDRTSPDEMKTEFRRMLGFVKEQVLRQPSHDQRLRDIMSSANG